MRAHGAIRIGPTALTSPVQQPAAARAHLAAIMAGAAPPGDDKADAAAAATLAAVLQALGEGAASWLPGVQFTG